MLHHRIAKSLRWKLLLLVAVVGVTLASAEDNTRSPHGNLNVPCQNCHTVYGWKPIRAVPEFDHNQTKFPLRGMHEGVNCVHCHTKMVFSNVGTKCADCHADIHRGKMSASCQNCHTVRGWNVSVTQINMHMNRFPLTGAHAAAACEDCHKNGGLSQFTALSTDCLSCHRSEFSSTTNPAHATGTFFATTLCQSCHTTDSWANAKFDHSVTGFMLTGSHAVPPRQCEDCHKNHNYNLTAADTACITCHQTDYNSTTNPNHAQQAQIFPTTCQNCHTTVAWQPAQFDHSTTQFPLTGAHTVPPRQCNDCHVNNNYNITVTTCVSCHLKDFNTTTNPNHVQGAFPQTCQTCHTTTTWQPASFDHSKTAFPLTGSHTVPPRACSDCHVNGNYNITVTTCVSCHQTDYNNAKTPVDHAGANFPTTCANCHDTVAWTDGKFDHSTTGWALTGSHTVPPRACSDCHINSNYNITVTTCVSCHQTDYNNTNNPNHAQQGIATTCEVCHTTSAWQPAQFDHAASGFPLTGAHTVPPRACTDCHVNNNYNLTNTACVSCHQTDYNNALSPVNHAAANFPTTCANCHDTVAWTDGTFDHSSTGFALTGAHTVPPRACTDCHTAAAGYNITNTTCVSCHQTDYNNATTPVNHIAAKLPTTCDSCHDTIQWSDGKFDHSTTGWALTGAHTVPPRACSDCHINGNYNITVTTCVSCHQTDYNNALTPVNHISANFPTTCQTCHDTIQWTDAKFDHASTGWALTGSHTVPPRACTDCHVSNNYNLTSTTCVTCHQNDYNNAVSPVNHVAAKFPTTCDGCHDTIAWTDGTFNHATTGWALTGSHTVPPRACADCHTASAGYNITVTTCVSCHQSDYNNATTPVNHITANFPLTCDTCHDTIQWTDGKFDHSTTGWALTGSHTVPPRACTDCHINNNYSLTSTACVTCHQTDYNNTNNPAHAAAGFPTTCNVCHDTITWTDSTFNHNNTAFPLQGAHTTVPCANCHVNNNYTTLPTDCYGCHATDYNNTTNPNHKAAGFPTTCLTCHTTWVTTNWLGAVFNHTWFPTSHGNANGVCSTCHTNPSDYSIFQCTNCHTKTQTDSNHQGVKGYVYNSVSCYQCHPTGRAGG